MLYRYAYSKHSRFKVLFRWFSAGFFVLGITFMSLAIVPMATWQVSQIFFPVELKSPVINKQGVLGVFAENKIVRNSDYSNPNSWFTGVSFEEGQDKYYYLTIKKLNIRGAKVKIGGSDLFKSLIAWPTGALPGSMGNTIVFGHSALPIFYNPSSYTTMFTHVYDLRSGDEIEIDYDGVKYKYVVESKKTISPTDLSVLEQNYASSKLVLITCVPPGTYLKRGVITAKLVQI